MSDAKRSSGQFTRIGDIEILDLDCSQWPRDHSKPRSRGKFVRVGQRPAAHEAAANEPTCLELVVNLAEDVQPMQVWTDVNLLLQRVQHAAPELKLTYDALRSRTENGDFVIALRSVDLAAAEQQLSGLLNLLRNTESTSVRVRAIRLAA